MAVRIAVNVFDAEQCTLLLPSIEVRSGRSRGGM